jgi:hypothetical protein
MNENIKSKEGLNNKNVLNIINKPRHYCNENDCNDKLDRSDIYIYKNSSSLNNSLNNNTKNNNDMISKNQNNNINSYDCNTKKKAQYNIENINNSNDNKINKTKINYEPNNIKYNKR